MKQVLASLVFVVLLSSCTHTYYVVRHAEKAQTPPNDPPLTQAGMQRADQLRDLLSSQGIKHIYSTNFVRTQSTARPLSVAINVPITTYAPGNEDAFVAQLKTLKKNTLVVGHSNTIDDIVNKLCDAIKVPADINEAVFNNLFVVKYRGKKIFFEARTY